MNTTFIYALKDPDTGQIRYVGATVNPKQRLYLHLSRARREKRNNPRLALLRSYQRGNLKPVLTILDEVPEPEWQQWEVAYIEYFRECGCDLVNSSPGGNGTGRGVNSPSYGRKLSAEIRAKISAAHKGRKFSEEHRLSLSRRKISLTWRENLSKAKTGISIPSGRNMQGANNPMYGRRHSIETRLKMSGPRK